MIRRVILIALFAHTLIMAPCQENVKAVFLQPHRFEKEVKFSEDNFMVLSLNQEGLALIRDKQKFKSGNKTWEIILLDNTLQVIHEFDLEVDQRKNMIGYDYAPGILFLLYRVPEIQRSSLELITINLLTAEIAKLAINPELTFQLSHFIRVGNHFVFGGYVTNEPAVLLFNPVTDNLKVLPGFFQKQTELIDLRPNQNETFNAVLMDRSDRDNRKLIFKTFDVNGIELLQDGCQIEERYVLQTGLSSSLIRDDLLLVGTWGIRTSKQSVGFYALPIDPFTDQKVRYIYFGELNHFLDNINPKKAKRIKDRTQEAIKLQKVPDFSNHVVPHRLEEHESAYILLAEVFTPTPGYDYQRYPDTPLNYYPYPYSPFWGYYPGMYRRMYHPFSMQNVNTRSSDEVKIALSVLIAFDNKGAVLWDHSLNLNEIRIPTLEQVADFCIIDDQVIFLYKKESEVVVKTIQLSSGEVSETNEKIQLLKDTDELRTEDKTFGAVRYWYGTNFFVWGQHSLRDRANRDEGVRQVFYINKLQVD